jgi:hypothetical protein
MKKILENYGSAIALILLGLMLALGLASMTADSGIVDEVAHIPAGYSYLKFGDYRLNPEHPPLLKDLAAIPLLFLNLKFPTSLPAWTSLPNGQWETGWNFIYHIGNNADLILFCARLPILLLAIAFGYFFYRFCRKRYGTSAALLALFFFTLSPNLLAHARFVTTDLGIAAFMFFSFYAFFKFLEKPCWKNLIIAAVFFALMQLSKFSAVIMYPFYGLLALIPVVTWQKPNRWQERAKIYLGGLVLIFIIGFVLTWAFYIPHTRNMPLDVQDRLIADSLKWGLGQKVAALLIKLNDYPLMKSLTQYLLGVAMVFNRVQGGNTTYFMGQVTNQSFAWYFPVSYAIKTPVTELFLLLLALLSGIYRYFKKTPLRIFKKFTAYARTNFVELSLILFVLFYVYVSIKGNLNLGIRHLFPILPVIFALIAKKTVDFVKKASAPIGKAGVIAALALLLVWYGLSNILTFPYYVAYFNEIIGGPTNAYKYVSDSNVDWGQDLKRLKAFVDSNPQINKIAVDYFGGGEPKYYFCDRLDDKGHYDCAKSAFLEWHAENGRPPTNYIAVSETFLMNDLWWASGRGDEGYAWLRAQEPIVKIGYSIYVYKIK